MTTVLVGEVELPRIGERWRHYRGGTYRILGLCYHERTGKMRIAYRSAEGGGPVFVRSVSTFLGLVPEGTEKGCARFARIPFEPFEEKTPAPSTADINTAVEQSIDASESG